MVHMLIPAATLICWTIIVVFIWMSIARVRGINAAKINMSAKPGGRGIDLEGRVAPQAQWPVHNYNHLLEQPTLFYAIIAFMVIAERWNGVDIGLAWAYVALRIMHSVWQCTVNTVNTRALFFLISSVVLMVMAVRLLIGLHQ